MRRVHAVGGSSERRELVDNRAEEISVEDGLLALYYHRQSLQAHAGIYVTLLEGLTPP